ncbi:mandelate racemase/muconate lactonizing enzyme family protein [Allopusillimonas ginsengisoli]|uniref:mandelate racemase/muconate lactonizing enzyme family protein n=1 Tax=Allopusillimonas ginsengisoli TaxID=453575 RepID=UPI001FD6B402|nr:mandelate racemase/muconate lactonizing enzyme family protein [Allopusillimonas ginsengisoli]
MLPHHRPPLPQDPLTISSIKTYVYRAPITKPVKTSFGTMHDRPAVFVQVIDTDGVEGWGEAWCNFPACGAEYRAQLIDVVLAPLLVGRAFSGPSSAFSRMMEQTQVLALQCGEPGPLSQAVSGIDIALWDLSARRAGLPLWKYLGGVSDDIGVYASGINPDDAVGTVRSALSAGHSSFKLKVGFDDDKDLRNVECVRDMLGSEHSLMLDANQGWDIPRAMRMTALLEGCDIAWIEEPLRANVRWPCWKDLAHSTDIPLAAGENLIGAPAFDEAIMSGALRVIQPDIAKWGGISGNWPVIARILAKSLRYCPHYLGGGIGLLASAHLLAATGANGILEIDANPNPLRTFSRPAFSHPDQGRVKLGSEPGLGVLPTPGEWETVARRCH